MFILNFGFYGTFLYSLEFPSTQSHWPTDFPHTAMAYSSSSRGYNSTSLYPWPRICIYSPLNFIEYSLHYDASQVTSEQRSTLFLIFLLSGCFSRHTLGPFKNRAGVYTPQKEFSPHNPGQPRNTSFRFICNDGRQCFLPSISNKARLATCDAFNHHYSGIFSHCCQLKKINDMHIVKLCIFLCEWRNF